jgi:hypothetical protein
MMLKQYWIWPKRGKQNGEAHLLWKRTSKTFTQAVHAVSYLGDRNDW